MIQTRGFGKEMQNQSCVFTEAILTLDSFILDCITVQRRRLLINVSD